MAATCVDAALVYAGLTLGAFALFVAGLLIGGGVVLCCMQTVKGGGKNGEAR